MARTLDPFQFVLVAVAGWMNQRQQASIEFLREENRILASSLVTADCASMMTGAVAELLAPKG